MPVEFFFAVGMPVPVLSIPHVGYAFSQIFFSGGIVVEVFPGNDAVLLVGDFDEDAIFVLIVLVLFVLLLTLGC